MCCYTGFEVSSQRIEAQTMRDGRGVRITEKCVSVCESVCLHGLDPTWKAALSAWAVICVERHFTVVFAQEDSGQKQSFLPFPHIDVHKQQTQMQRCVHVYTRIAPAHSNPEEYTHMHSNTHSCQKRKPTVWGIITHCVKNKLKISSECSPLNKDEKNATRGKPHENMKQWKKKWQVTLNSAIILN